MLSDTVAKGGLSLPLTQILAPLSLLEGVSLKRDLITQNSALKTQHLALSTQHSALKTQH